MMNWAMKAMANGIGLGDSPFTSSADLPTASSHCLENSTPYHSQPNMKLAMAASMTAR